MARRAACSGSPRCTRATIFAGRTRCTRCWNTPAMRRCAFMTPPACSSTTARTKKNPARSICRFWSSPCASRRTMRATCTIWDANICSAAAGRTLNRCSCAISPHRARHGARSAAPPCAVLPARCWNRDAPKTQKAGCCARRRKRHTCANPGSKAHSSPSGRMCGAARCISPRPPSPSASAVEVM